MKIQYYIKKLVYRLRGLITTEELIRKGMSVGKNFQRMHNVNIDESHCWLIKIGNNVTMAPNVQVLAHDASTKMLTGYTKIGSVKIGDNVFIGAGTIILPGTTIGNDVVIGAGSVISGTILSDSLYLGNPGKRVCSITEFKEKQIQRMKKNPKYDESYTVNGGITKEKKEKMKKEVEKNLGYVR